MGFLKYFCTSLLEKTGKMIREINWLKMCRLQVGILGKDSNKSKSYSMRFEAHAVMTIRQASVRV
jgi:hypothetical protein